MRRFTSHRSHQLVDESRNACFFPVIVRMQKNRQDLSLYVSNSTKKLSHSFSSFFNIHVVGWCTVWCALRNNFVTPRGYSYIFFDFSQCNTSATRRNLQTLESTARGCCISVPSFLLSACCSLSCAPRLVFLSLTRHP